MPTRKKATSTKKAAAKSAGAKAATGPVPPYGEAIRGAVARGDAQEMKDVAANAKKWVADVQAALKQLDTAVKKTKKR